MPNELQFAVDIVLISQNKEELAEMMTNLFEECKTSRLKANKEKTKIMTNMNEIHFNLNGKNKEKFQQEYQKLGMFFQG